MIWIRLRNILVYAYHGVHAYEQEHGARFEIDFEFTVDSARVASDDLTETIDYAKVQQFVRYQATTRKFKLIEALAKSLAETFVSEYGHREVIVRVRKPGAAIGGIVDTVEVEYHVPA